MSNSERENFFDQAVGLNVVHELLQREHSSTSPDDSEHAIISSSLIKVKQVVKIVSVCMYVCVCMKVCICVCGVNYDVFNTLSIYSCMYVCVLYILYILYIHTYIYTYIHTYSPNLIRMKFIFLRSSRQQFKSNSHTWTQITYTRVYTFIYSYYDCMNIILLWQYIEWYTLYLSRKSARMRLW
jgi:hypothetical protein